MTKRFAARGAQMDKTRARYADLQPTGYTPERPMSDLQRTFLEARSERRPSSYQQYLNTAEWMMRKLAILSERGSRCIDCRRTDKPVQLHHLSYERLGRELPEDLVILCAVCHGKRHRGEKLIESHVTITQVPPSRSPGVTSQRARLANPKNHRKNLYGRAGRVRLF